MFGFGGGAKKKKAKTARERAMVRLMESMEAKVDDTDKSSVELQHFWKIMLRGMQVRILAQVKGKGVLSDNFWVFWMSAGAEPVLYLRQDKVAKPATGLKAKLTKGRSMALHQLNEVRYGGLKVGVGAGLAGEYDEDDEDDEETGAPCLNKMVALHAKDGQVIEFEVTQRAAELLLDKFTIVIAALDMFEKVETQLQYQDELA
jgi:hypothetical protein